MLGFINQDYPPAFEWFRPSDVVINTLPPSEKAHVESGGLLLRPIVVEAEEEEVTEDKLTTINVTKLLGIPSSFNSQMSWIINSENVDNLIKMVSKTISSHAAFVSSSEFVARAYLEHNDIKIDEKETNALIEKLKKEAKKRLDSQK